MKPAVRNEPGEKGDKRLESRHGRMGFRLVVRIIHYNRHAQPILHPIYLIVAVGWVEGTETHLT